MPNIYFPESAAKQYNVGQGIGGLVDRIARQRAERQRELEEAAKLKADKDETLKNLMQSMSKEQWDQLPPEAQALFMSEGVDFSNPALQSVVEQAQSGEVPSSLRSPEYKLSEGGRELANTKTKIQQSSGGGFWDFGQVAKAAGGALSRAADIISRPAYGVMEGIDSAIDAVQNNDMGELLNADVLRALSGKEKTTGSDVLMNFFDIDEDEYDALPAWAKVAIPIAGLAGDIALDPLTYTGAGLVSKLRKAGQAVTDVTQVTGKFSRAEAAAQLGKTATEAGQELSPDAVKVLSEVITPAANQMLDDVGMDGTRVLEELTATGAARRKTPFQPQEITAQTAALGETAGLRAAGQAKTLESAGRAAGSTEAERALQRAAGIERRAAKEGLLPKADELDTMKKRDLFNLAKQEGYIDAGQGYSSITRQSLVSKIKSNPQYRSDVVSRAAKHEETVGNFRTLMNDATKALGDQRMADLTVDRTLAIKFQTPLGRKVWSTIELPGITKGVMSGLEKLNRASKGRASDWAGKALRNFSRSAQLGKGLHAIERVAMHTAYGEVQPAMKALSHMLSEVGLTDITKAEQDAIWRAIDRGTVEELSEGHQTIAVNLQKLWDTQAKERLDLGMLKNDELITDPATGNNAFVPLYFKGRVPARIKREIREQRIAGFKLDQIFANPKYAKYERLVEKDLGKIATMATRDHAERMGRYALWKQANEQFFLDGSKIANKEARNKAIYDAKAAGFVPLTSVAKDIGTDDLHRLFGDLDVKNIYVPPELEEPLRRLTSWQYSDEDLSAMLDVYKRSMRAIKLSLTMANPGYHLRNLRGDVQLNIMDGVTDPRRYRQAARLLRTSGDVKYQGNLKNLPELTDEIAAARQANIGTQYQGFSVTPETAFQASLDTTGMKTMRIGGVDMPMDEVLRHFNLSGGRTGWTQAEIDNSVGARGSRSAWQRGKAKVAGWSEAREELPRLAHFIDKLDYRMKEAGITAKDIQKNSPRFVEAMQKAGNDVRKFNIDYSDLTKTEENIKNYAIPFYTWMKKNTALQLEMMATRPVFAAGWSHAVREAQEWMQRDPYGNEITPAWIDEAIGVPGGRVNNDLAAVGLGLLGFGGMAGVPFMGDQPMGPMDNTLYMTPFGDSPFANALEPFEAVATLFDNTQSGGFEGLFRPGEAFKEAARFGVNQLAPQFQIPIEQATGTSLFTGGSAKLSAGTLPSEVSPLFNVLNNAFITGNTGPEDYSRLWNWATGGNAQFVTPQMKAGEVARQSEDVDKIWSKMRDDVWEALGIDLDQKVKP